jgi:hypothetical protein
MSRRRRYRLAAAADQLAVVVADIADAMSHIEGRLLLTATMGSAANCAQGAAMHPEVPAALLIGARRQSLPMCRKSEATEHDRSEYPENCSHLDLPPG